MRKHTFLLTFVLFLTVGLFSFNSSYFLKKGNIVNKAQSELKDSISEGEKLFKSNCRSCHKTDNTEMVGPGLASATSKYSSEWLYKWTTNSSLLISSGDKKALALYYKYGKTVQPSFFLTREEVTAIYKYIDSLNSQKSVR